MKKRTQTVEYKETKVFDLFPEFEYTRQQRARCILFHCYAKNIVAMIHYAKNFDVANKICLVYVVGEPKPEKIIKTLEEADCSSNVCVITSQFSKEEQKLYDEFEAVRKKLWSSGGWDREKDDIADAYIERHNAQYQTLRKLKSQGWPDEKLHSTIRLLSDEDEYIETVRKYRKLYKHVRKVNFKNFRMYRRGCLVKPFSHDKLAGLINKIFPQGAEAIGLNDFAALSPIGIEQGSKQELTGIPNPRLKFSVDDDTPLVRHIVKFMNKELSERGYLSLSELGDHIKQPPFGAMPCAYTAACIVRAVRKFDNRTLLFFDEAGTHIAKGLGLVFMTYAYPPKNFRRDGFLYIESHPHKTLKKVIHDVFGTKMEVPTARMISSTRRNLESNYRYPVSAVDDRLYRILEIGWELYNRDAVQSLCDEIDGRTRELQEAFSAFVATDKRDRKLWNTIFPVCAPWLWDKDRSLRHIRNADIILDRMNKKLTDQEYWRILKERESESIR